MCSQCGGESVRESERQRESVCVLATYLSLEMCRKLELGIIFLFLQLVKLGLQFVYAVLERVCQRVRRRSVRFSARVQCSQICHGAMH
jgi:hypothetical protein